MDEQSRNAILLLNAFNLNKERLRIFAYRMLSRHQSELKKAYAYQDLYGLIRVDGENYEGRSMLAACATFTNERCVDWFTTLHWNATCWEIETEVAIDSEVNVKDVYMQTITDFPIRQATTLEGCIISLSEAVSDLINTGDALDVLANFEKTKNESTSDFD
jgi:hypothetical protein